MDQEQNADDFKSFYQKYLRLVQFLIRRRLIDENDVEEAAYEVMLRAWRTGTHLVPEQHAKARLMRIINSVLVDMWRGRRRKHHALFTDLDVEPETVADDREGESVVHWLTSYLDRLPPGQFGEVIQCGWEVSRDRNGFNYQEMGRRLNRTPNGVRAAVWKLKRILLEEFGWGAYLNALKSFGASRDLLASIEEYLLLRMEQISCSKDPQLALAHFWMAKSIAYGLDFLDEGPDEFRSHKDRIIARLSPDDPLVLYLTAIMVFHIGLLFKETTLAVLGLLSEFAQICRESHRSILEDYSLASDSLGYDLRKLFDRKTGIVSLHINELDDLLQFRLR